MVAVKNLRPLREREPRVSQRELAPLCGISQSRLSSLERGIRPRLEEIEALSKALSVPQAALLEDIVIASDGRVTLLRELKRK